MKRYPLYPLIVTGCGLALTLAGFLPPLIRALTDPPVIIGGADFHSLWFMLSKPPADILLTCGLPLLLTGLVWLIFHRAVERGCHRKTTLYALAVTARERWEPTVCWCGFPSPPLARWIPPPSPIPPVFSWACHASPSPFCF